MPLLMWNPCSGHNMSKIWLKYWLVIANNYDIRQSLHAQFWIYSVKKNHQKLTYSKTQRLGFNVCHYLLEKKICTVACTCIILILYYNRIMVLWHLGIQMLNYITNFYVNVHKHTNKNRDIISTLLYVQPHSFCNVVYNQ